MLLIVDVWDRDQWGRWVPGACVRYQPTPTFGNNGYITEDATEFYCAEDGVTIYVEEN